jgi:hypothetical protein
MQCWLPQMELFSAKRFHDLLSSQWTGGRSFRLDVLGLYQSNVRAPAPGVSPSCTEHILLLREAHLAVAIPGSKRQLSLLSQRGRGRRALWGSSSESEQKPEHRWDCPNLWRRRSMPEPPCLPVLCVNPSSASCWASMLGDPGHIWAHLACVSLVVSNRNLEKKSQCS